MLPRRIILAALVAASLLAAGCVKEAVKTLSELQSLNIALSKK